MIHLYCIVWVTCTYHDNIVLIFPSGMEDLEITSNYSTPPVSKFLETGRILMR